MAKSKARSICYELFNGACDNRRQTEGRGCSQTMPRCEEGKAYIVGLSPPFPTGGFRGNVNMNALL